MVTKLRIFCFLGRARNRFQKLWASTLSRCRLNVLYANTFVLLEYVCFSCNKIPTTFKAKLAPVNNMSLGTDELTFPLR